ncbi:glycosyltransferase family 2 protein [Trichocoleus sp. FACHB-262]|uniref:glycosyltransferase family 2 protein n=1 Tax=Trichocoleus sp. FACHB-262 TaxID=2692869 RepID=UPI0016820071|nr:glycosyltransferase family 2 protein [Trichocoleus sp. FACHB-262]MBD2123054.1 glycosyltransferase family 2 protein [Trichocoleus sp. FACHB-262]
MRFSIVITTYNRLSLLKRAIASALDQTVSCEVVVVDNCSSDGTEAYVRSLGNQVVYHRNSANLGHSGAVNTGVKVAKGTWIKPVDDDDYLAPNCIEEMAKAIALRPEAAICSCQAAQVDDNGVELSRTRQVGPGQAFYIPQEDVHYGMLLEQVPFGTPIQVAFRRDAFLESGGWDTSLTSCDDIDSWIRIAKYGDAIFINQCLTYRTVWPGGYDQKIALETRMNTNILMKERIHALVNEKYRSAIPAIQDIRHYLCLHWGLVALKQKKIVSGLQMVLPATASPAAWKLLLGARKGHQPNPTVRKLVLLDVHSSAPAAMLMNS